VANKRTLKWEHSFSTFLMGTGKALHAICEPVIYPLSKLSFGGRMNDLTVLSFFGRKVELLSHRPTEHH
jgi:hypothetical protein